MTKTKRARILMYIVLVIVSLVSVFPLYWMLMAATNKSVDVSRGRLLPGGALIDNIKALFSQQPVRLAMFNSFKFALVLWQVMGLRFTITSIKTLYSQSCF